MPAKDSNAPLRIGQWLEPRDDSATRPCRIVGYRLIGGGMAWEIEPTGGGPVETLTLSEIYATFQFDN